VNRVKRVREACADLFGKKGGTRWHVVRTSNSYTFADPKASRGPKLRREPPIKIQTRKKTYGQSSSETTLWLINQGRKYVEAPRWAAIGVVVVMLVFAYNVIGTAYAARRITGITAVLMIDLVPLILLYRTDILRSGAPTPAGCCR
jgi:hypothetical protein